MKRGLLCGTMLLLAAIFTCGQVWGAEEAEPQKILLVSRNGVGQILAFLKKVGNFYEMPAFKSSNVDAVKNAISLLVYGEISKLRYVQDRALPIKPTFRTQF